MKIINVCYVKIIYYNANIIYSIISFFNFSYFSAKKN